EVILKSLLINVTAVSIPDGFMWFYLNQLNRIFDPLGIIEYGLEPATPARRTAICKSCKVEVSESRQRCSPGKGIRRKVIQWVLIIVNAFKFPKDQVHDR